MPYRNKQEAVEALRPGWKISGEAPNMVDVTNPRAGLAGEPATIKQPQGTVLTIQSPTLSDPPDTVVIKEVGNAPWKGGVGYDVVQGPQRAVPKPASQASDVSGWQPVYRVPGDASSQQVGQWDPVNNEFHPLAAEPGGKPSGTYTNIVDPNDPNKKRVIGMVDDGDGSWHPVSADPNLPGRQIITTPTAVYAVDASNNVSKLVDIDKNSPFQAVIVDGKPFRFDPNTGAFTAGPVTEHPDIKDQNGLVMVWQADAEGGGKYGYPPGVKPAAGLSVNTQAPNLIWYDTEGNVVATRANDNYRPPAPTLPQVGANAPKVPIEDPDKPGTIKWIPNEGRVTAPQALQDLAASLTNTVVDPSHPLTLEDAKALLESAGTQMTNAQAAAATALQTTTQAATTGAGLLNQRVSAGQGMLSSVLGLAGQRPLAGLAPGAGQALMSDIQGFATQLGGGQDVYDTAARLVKAADPNGGGSPMAQAAYGVITQMLERYQQQNNQPHPAVQATAAAKASVQGNGMVAPASLGMQTPYPTQSPAYASSGLGPVMANQFTAPPLVAAGAPPPLAINNLGNTDPRLRGAIY